MKKYFGTFKSTQYPNGFCFGNIWAKFDEDLTSGQLMLEYKGIYQRNDRRIIHVNAVDSKSGESLVYEGWLTTFNDSGSEVTLNVTEKNEDFISGTYFRQAPSDKGTFELFSEDFNTEFKELVNSQCLIL